LRKDYEAPKLKVLGSLQELTQQKFNKVGGSTDAYSTEQNQLVGSVVPFP
jgi:hypothetical protein